MTKESLRLADASDSGTQPYSVRTRARALNSAGMLAHYQAHYARATTLCRQSLALCRTVDDQPGMADALHGLALVARRW